MEIARWQKANLGSCGRQTSLIQLWAEQGEWQKAYDLVVPMYGWFTESFDTQDLKDANALLHELR